MSRTMVNVIEQPDDPTSADASKEIALRKGDFWRNTVTNAWFQCLNPGTGDWRELLMYDSNAEFGGIGKLRQRDTLITSAQVLALNATPQTIIPAPGIGKYLTLEQIEIFLDFNSAAYAGIAVGEDLAVKYTNASGALIVPVIETTGFLDATADALAIAKPAASVVAVVNSPIVLHLLVGEVITGDSPLKVRCRYRELRAASLEAIS